MLQSQSGPHYHMRHVQLFLCSGWDLALAQCIGLVQDFEVHTGVGIVKDSVPQPY